MALIGKIRNNMWLVFIIIALATASFILMDAMGPGGGSMGGPNANTPVGVIAGQKVNQTEFERAYQALFNNAQNPNASRAALWNFFVENGIVTKEAEKLGMYIGEEEMEDLQFGTNLSPVIRNSFTNPNTGVLDVAQLQQIKAQLEGGAAVNPQLQVFWNEQARQVKKEQLQTKINSLAQKAIYTPNWMAESGYIEENGTFDIAVVKIPFDNMEAGDITVSDSDISNYIAKNKKAYELKEENRKIAFLTLNVIPSAEDSASIIENMEGIIANFSKTANDSSFAVTNNGFYSNGYGKPSQVDEFYKDKLSTYEIGGVYGPYQVGRTYQAVKVIDRRAVPDSVKARHILKRVAPGNTTQLDEANRIIDSLQTVLSRNKSKFAELADTFSEDASNNGQGGDLGYFEQGRMLQSFNDVCFVDGKEGGLYKVRTTVGVHLVYIEDRKFIDNDLGYKLAYVSTPIIPGNKTESEGYSTMIDLISNNQNLAELKDIVASNPNISVETSPNVDANAYSIANLGDGRTTRDIVKWAFGPDAEPNTVAESVYEFNDPIAYYTSKYVIAGLESISPPGMPAAADLRSQTEFAILNELKAEKTASEISGSDLNGIASKYGVLVDTIRNLNLLNNFVQGLGNEPKVLGAASGLASGSVSGPILGNSGVFVVKTISKSDAGAVSNIGSIKRTMASNKKSGIQFSLMEALKSKYDIKDNRAVFY